ARQPVEAGPIDDLGAGGRRGVARLDAANAAALDDDERAVDDLVAVPKPGEPDGGETLRARVERAEEEQGGGAGGSHGYFLGTEMRMLRYFMPPVWSPWM